MEELTEKWTKLKVFGINSVHNKNHKDVNYYDKTKNVKNIVTQRPKILNGFGLIAVYIKDFKVLFN